QNRPLYHIFSLCLSFFLLRRPLISTLFPTRRSSDLETDLRKADFADFRVDAEMMEIARKDALFMHCLPAHRGEEVEADVIDGPRSEEHTSELQSREKLVCRLLLEKKKTAQIHSPVHQ